MTAFRFKNRTVVCQPWFALLLLLSYALPGLSQNEYKFQHYTTEDGMSHNTPNCFLQDHMGFIWVGTNSGLDRFDGYKFRSYHTIPGDSTSLSGMKITSLYLDSTNNLWVGTSSNGLNLFDRAKNRFFRFQHLPGVDNGLNTNGIAFIFERKAGIYYIGTYGGGLNIYNSHTGSFRHLTLASREDAAYNILNGYALDKKGNIWLATESGVLILKPENNQIRKYLTRPNDLDLLAGEAVTSLVADKKGNIWVGTWTKGLYCYNIKTGRFTHFTHTKWRNQTYQLLKIKALWCDSHGDIWAGTFYNGLFRYMPSRDNFEIYLPNENDEWSLSGNMAYPVYEDNTGILWVGCDNNGINKADLNSKSFGFRSHANNPGMQALRNISAIVKDNYGNTWLGSWGDGLFKVAPNDEFHHFKASRNPNSLIYDAVVCLETDIFNNLWVGTAEGLCRYDIERGTFEQFPYNPLQAGGISNGAIMSLYADSSGYLWIGTWGGGLDKYDIRQKQFVNYTIDEDNKFNNVIWSIIPAHPGKLWLGCSGRSLVLFDQQTGAMKYYDADPNNFHTLHTNLITTLYAQEGTLWIGTGGAGLARLDIKSDSVTTYSEANGLPNNIINGILEDNHGHLWISTGKGISRFDPKTLEFKNFDVRDGLQGNSFVVNSKLKTKDGMLYFGGTNGYNHFHPDSIKDNPHKPKVVITDFHIFYQQVQSGEAVNGKIVITHDISLTNEVRLNHSINIITLEFAGLHYSVPEKNLYRYRLEGFEDRWTITTADRRQVTYTNLNPGKYSFKVFASNNDGVWCNDPAILSIVVNPPYWMTWWFRILIVTLLLGLVFAIYSYRVSKINRSKHILEKLIEERTREIKEKNRSLSEQAKQLTEQAMQLNETNTILEERQQYIEEQSEELTAKNEQLNEALMMKDKFFSIVAHDLKNPLNTLMGFSELVYEHFDRWDREKILKVLGILKESSIHIYKLLENLLKWARSQRGLLDVKPELIRLENLINTVVEVLKESAEQKQIKMETNIAANALSLYADPEMVETILRNLVANAVKFTSNGGRVWVNATNKNGKIIIMVRDTGVGIPKEVIPRLFRIDSKHSTMGTNKETGTGLGLLLCKEFVEKHGGQMWVESEIDKGSVFYVEFPGKT